jgi:hypothetical protein
MAPGLVGKTRADAVRESKQYVDDVRKAGKLAPLPFTYAPYELDTGFEGLGFREGETTEFKELAQYLKAQRGEVRLERLPDVGRSLLEEMDKSADLFFRRLTVTNSNDSLYSHIPVLHTVDPKRFISQLLQKTASEQSRILLTFRSRYDSGELDRELKDEKPWLASVRSELQKRLPELPRLAQYRLRGLIESTMGRYLEAHE